MNFSYDYSEFLTEIKEEIADCILFADEYIQVLRRKTPAYDDYRPIIDWYYNKRKMIMLASDMSAAEMKQYKTDLPMLESMTVADFLAEMNYRYQLIK